MTDDDDRDEFGNIRLARMTPEEQIRQQSGPGMEGRYGFVVMDPGPHAWYCDEHGQWRQVDDERAGDE